MIKFPMRCFLCKKNKFELIYKLKNKNILRCKNDDLLYAQKTGEDKVYGEEYYSNEPNKFNQSYFHKKLSTIQQLAINNSPHILDVGCGWGDFEEVLQKEKIPYLGIDVNKQSIKICQEKGLNCIQTNIETLVNSNGWQKWKGSRERAMTDKVAIQNHKESQTMYFQAAKLNISSKMSTRGRETSGRTHHQDTFDVITMFQLIEHLKNPLPLLQSAKKLLKKNGVILITTPNNDSPLRKIIGSRWSVYNEPSHFVFYNKETLEKTLKLADFKDVKVHLDSTRFLSLQYIFNRLKQMYLPNFKFRTCPERSRRISDFRFDFPIPTDPWGDLITLAKK